MIAGDLASLFAPRSVALIGASDTPGSSGQAALQILRAGGWQGRLDLVNPRHAKVGGQAAVASIAQLAAPPDLAIVCAPAAAVPASLRALARIGARAALVPGILPPGTRHAVFKAARAGALRILGPGAGAILLPAHGLYAGLLRQRPQAGALALVCASSSFAAAALEWAEERALGFALVCVLGEAADVDAADLLDHVAQQVGVRALLLQLERLPPARKFMSAARACARNKPVLLLKSPAPRGRDADDAVFDAACRRAGLQRARALDEMLELAELYARLGEAVPARVAICGNAPGPARIARQALEAAGCTLPAPGEAARARLVSILPPWRDAANPLDLAHEADAQAYLDALAALADDAAADLLLCLHAPVGSPAAPLAAAVSARAAQLPRRLMTVWMGGADAAQARRDCRAAGVPAYGEPCAPARLLARAHAYQGVRALQLQTPAPGTALHIDWAARQRAIDQLLALGERRLGARAALDWLAGCGLSVAREDAPAPQPAPARGLQLRQDPWLGPCLGMTDVHMPGGIFALLPLTEVFADDFLARAGIAAPARPAWVAQLLRLSELLGIVRGLASMRLELVAAAGACLLTKAEIRCDGRLDAPGRLLAIRPYPGELERHLNWAGRDLTLRPMRAEDATLHRVFFSHLDAEDLRLRFFAPMHEVHQALIARLTQIDYDREMAIVAVDAAAGGAGEFLGVARAVAAPDGKRAEFALIVRSDHKRRGLGRLLLQALIDYLTTEGVEELHGDVLHYNMAMVDLARSLGFSVHPGDDGELRVSRRLAARPRR